MSNKLSKYRYKKTDWWTVCKCNKRFDIKYLFTATRGEISEAFYKKHKVTLFPSRCENCREEEGFEE